MGYRLLIALYDLLLKFGAVIETIFAPFYFALFGSKYNLVRITKSNVFYDASAQEFLELYKKEKINALDKKIVELQSLSHGK